MKSQTIAMSRETGIFHQYSRKRTYVKKVRGAEILRFTAGYEGIVNAKEHYYVGCDKFGNFDWRRAKVYASHALVGVDNVFIVRPPEEITTITQ
jgi:hypothetical protein